MDSHLDLEIEECRRTLLGLEAAVENQRKKLDELLRLKRSDNIEIINGNYKLSNEEVRRYSRQLMLPEIGVKGQLALINGSALVVGGGGLGCPAVQYMAAAGIGRIGVVDYDSVELSNLHRQILHGERKIGLSKCLSIKDSIAELNSSVKIETHELALDRSNVFDVLSGYDIVLDASDNVPTRYLLNDACVILKKPLVSGSALRFEGQMTVFNYPPGVGTTYRCLYPKPPPPETVTNCSDGGVLGVVPGVIGCLQALEAIKILVKKEQMNEFVFAGKMLLFDGFSGSFRSVKLRPRQPGSEIESLVDYVEFCGVSSACDKDVPISILPDSDRIDVFQLRDKLREDEEEGSKILLVDVRSAPEMEIASIPNSVNVPIAKIPEKIGVVEEKLRGGNKEEIVVICRKGNDSQKAVLQLRSHFESLKVRDVIGGLNSWAENIDPDFPIY